VIVGLTFETQTEVRTEIDANKALRKQAERGQLASQVAQSRAEQLWLAGKFETVEAAEAHVWSSDPDLYQRYLQEGV
jgi:hypothetical protein